MSDVVHLVACVAVDAVVDRRVVEPVDVGVCLRSVAAVDGEKPCGVDDQRRHGPVPHPLEVGDGVSDDDHRRHGSVPGRAGVAGPVGFDADHAGDLRQNRRIGQPRLDPPRAARIGDQDDPCPCGIEVATLVGDLGCIADGVGALRVAGVDHHRRPSGRCAGERAHDVEIAVDCHVFRVVIERRQEGQCPGLAGDDGTERLGIVDHQGGPAAHEWIDAREERCVIGPRGHDDDRVSGHVVQEVEAVGVVGRVVDDAVVDQVVDDGGGARRCGSEGAERRDAHGSGDGRYRCRARRCAPESVR